MADKTLNTGAQSTAERWIDMGDATFAKQVVSAKALYTLLTNYAAIGSGGWVGPMVGGDYVWRTEATNWNGGMATLEFMGLDGVSVNPVKKSDGTTNVTLTGNGSVSIGVAQGAFLRVTTSAGAPTGMNSVLGGL